MLKDFIRVLTATGIGQIFELISGFMVVKFLDPTVYGLLKILDIIKQLAKYGDMGFISIAKRDLPFYQGKNDSETVEKIRDNAYSAEILLALTLALLSFLLLLKYRDATVRIGIICAAFTMFLMKIENIMLTDSTVIKNFKIYSRALGLSSILYSVLIIGTVHLLGVYAPLIMPVVTASVVVVYLFIALQFRFQFRINKPELLRQLRIGLPFSMKSVAYGFYQWSERGIIAGFFGLRVLGLWGLAYTVQSIVLNYALSFSRVWYPNIMEKMGREGIEKVKTEVSRLVKASAILNFIVILFLLYNANWLIRMFLPKYIESIPILRLVMIIIYFWLPVSYISIILSAPTIEKQMSVFFIILIGLASFAGLSFTLKYFNVLSVHNIVMADVAGYLIMSALYIKLYIKIAKYSFGEALSFIWQIVWPFVLLIVSLKMVERWNSRYTYYDILLKNLSFGIIGTILILMNFDIKHWLNKIKHKKEKPGF